VEFVGRHVGSCTLAFTIACSCFSTPDMPAWNPGFSGFSKVGEKPDGPVICTMEVAVYAAYFRSFLMTVVPIPDIPLYP
jgi:hypothetical protein